jgi:hypothetical protein
MTVNACLLLIALAFQGPLSRFHPYWYVLTEPAVQRELGLTSKQIAQLASIQRKAADQVAKFRREEERKHVRHLVEDPNFAGPPLERFGKGLTPAQQERIVQITLQQYGAYVYDAPGVATELGLKEADLQRIGDAMGKISLACDLAVEKYAKDHHVPNRLVGGDMMMPVETAEIRKMHADRDAKLQEVLVLNLTMAQYDHLSRLLGKPFIRR